MSQTTTPPTGRGTALAPRSHDTLALNDIHAVLTSPALTGSLGDTRQAIVEILARTGRSPYPSRIIIATVDGPHGIPAACIDSEGTIVTIGQDPNGPGLRVDITPRDPADEAAIVIAVGDTVIRRAQSIGLRYGGPS